MFTQSFKSKPRGIENLTYQALLSSMGALPEHSQPPTPETLRSGMKLLALLSETIPEYSSSMGGSGWG